MAWFFIQLASKDLATQRKGLVTIYWLLGSRHAASDLASSQLGRNAAASIAPCFRAYPVRMAAIHLCFKETSFRYVFNFGTMVIERTTRVRCKAHVGKYPFLSHLLFSMMIMVSVSFSFVGGSLMAPLISSAGCEGRCSGLQICYFPEPSKNR